MSPGGFDSVATGPDDDVGGCEVDPAVEVSAGGADDTATDGDDDRTVEPGEGGDGVPCAALFRDDPPVEDGVEPTVGPAFAVTAAVATAELVGSDPAAGPEIAGVPEHPASATLTAATAVKALLGMSMPPPA